MKLLRLHPSLVMSSLVLLASLTLQCSDPGFDALPSEATEVGNIQLGLADITYFSGNNRVGGVFLSWGTRSESDCTGFHILRRVTGETDFKRVNATLIAAKSTDGANYEYLDEPLDVGTYDYQLEQIDTQGNSTTTGHFSVSVFSTKDGTTGDVTDADTLGSSGLEDVGEGSDCGFVPASNQENSDRTLLIAAFRLLS